MRCFLSLKLRFKLSQVFSSFTQINSCLKYWYLIINMKWLALLLSEIFDESETSLRQVWSCWDQNSVIYISGKFCNNILNIDTTIYLLDNQSRLVAFSNSIVEDVSFCYARHGFHHESSFWGFALLSSKLLSFVVIQTNFTNSKNNSVIWSAWKSQKDNWIVTYCRRVFRSLSKETHLRCFTGLWILFCTGVQIPVQSQ